jgi:DNA processing protein
VTDTREARLRLLRSANIGPVTYGQLIARFGSAEAALDALPMLAARGGGRAPVIADIGRVRREIAAVERLGARYLFLDDDAPIPRCSPSWTARRRR